MKHLFIYSVGLLTVFILSPMVNAVEEVATEPQGTPTISEPAISEPANPVAITPQEQYKVGVDDVLVINILEPEKLITEVIVSIDGLISFPYIGNVTVKDLSLSQIQDLIQQKLSEGYMKYPVVSVALKESRSRKFFVYGEVIRPGPYPVEENTTVLKAISLAGGFTKYGSSSRVKLLRPRKDGSGYETIKINMGSAMSGNSNADATIQPGDIMVVSEGIF